MALLSAQVGRACTSQGVNRKLGSFSVQTTMLVSLPFIASVGYTPCSSMQNIFASRVAGISSEGGQRTSVSIGLWIAERGTVGATTFSALLPVDDEPALDMEVVLICAYGCFTMRSVCIGAAGTGATKPLVVSLSERIEDKGVDAFSDSETSPSVMGSQG